MRFSECLNSTYAFAATLEDALIEILSILKLDILDLDLIGGMTKTAIKKFKKQPLSPNDFHDWAMMTERLGGDYERTLKFFNKIYKFRSPKNTRKSLRKIQKDFVQEIEYLMGNILPRVTNCEIYELSIKEVK